MKLDTTFDDIKHILRVCLRCRECTFGDWPENYPLCPIHRAHGVYTASAGGLISFMRALAEGKADYVPTIAELAYECPTCGFCDVCEVMPIQFPHAGPSDFIRFLRHQLVEHGLLPDGEMKALYERVKQNGDHPGDRVEVPGRQASDVLLFAECLYEKGEAGSYESALKLLGKMGKSAAVFGHGGSCGHGLYDMGFWDELDTLMTKRSEAVAGLQGKEVVFINPHCQKFMTRTYPEISASHETIAARHLSELLVDAFKAGRLTATKKQSLKVSYHDPCSLGRGLGIYGAPRQVLSFLDGVELVEMKRNRANAYCCGGTGKAFPDFSTRVAEDRLREFRETGADLLITACPSCKEALQAALPAPEKNRVRDLIEFVSETVG